MSDARLLLFPPGTAFADAVARQLVAEQREHLPDLSATTLIVAHRALAAPLRAALAAAAGGAVLAPRILTLAELAAQHRAAGALAPLSPLACRLQLAEWLGRLRNVFPDRDPMAVADALFLLFEELALAAATLPDDEAAFAEALRKAYRAPPLEALSREAALVHALWRPYREAIGDRAPAVAHLHGLAAAVTTLDRAILVGHDRLAPAEGALLAPLLASGRLRLWTRGRATGRDAAALASLLARLGLAVADDSASIASAAPRQRLLDAWLDDRSGAAPFASRAARVAGEGATGLRFTACASPEHEARSVALAVREALLAGQRRIAIVSGDRRLARRLRALLERANVALVDRVGWKLSTSRAAATLAAWLDALETGFHHRPLRDLLKSGFFVGEPLERPEPLLAARLDQALHFPAHGAARPPVAGLAAFAALVDGRWPALFERLQRGAAELPVAAPPRLAGDWAAAVLASLATIGLESGYAGDEAGAQVLGVLRKIRAATEGLPLRLGWGAFRALVDREIEAATFRPEATALGPRVQLVTLDATAGLDADLVILASATRAQLPGAAPGAVLFNEAVKVELGLEGWADRQRLALHRLRGLLDAAPEVRVSWAAERDDEPPQPSPWLESLAAFAEAAGFAPLADPALAARALAPGAEVAPLDPVDARPPSRPAPPTPAALLGDGLSASAHQALIDCPYQWFARRLLRLDPASDPDEDRSARDYGERLHLILAAFHRRVDPALPAPYQGPRDAAHREAVLAHLHRLADAVFAGDRRQRPMAAIWTRAFATIAPWLAERIVERGAADVEVEQEVRAERSGWQLSGRADRIERGADGLALVVDYKSGTLPKAEDVTAGEAVQLAHYALALGQVTALEYWGLREADDEGKRRLAVDGEALAALGTGIEARLAGLRAMLDAGQPLPAHGDDKTCARCDHAGLCRRASWPAEAMP